MGPNEKNILLIIGKDRWCRDVESACKRDGLWDSHSGL